MRYSYNSVAPKCAGGKPLPLCAPSSFGTRGAHINLTTCQCVPACPAGKYYLGETGTGAQCGTKAQYDAQNAQNQTVLNCINGGGTWDYNNSRCLTGGGGGGSGGLPSNITDLLSNPYLLIGGGILVLLLILIAK